MRILTSLSLSLIALSLISTPAIAGSSTKNVQLHFKNDSHNQKMTCTVYKIVAGKRRVLKSYTPTPKGERAEDDRHKPIVRTLKVKAVVKTLSGKYTFPKLQMKCSLAGNSHARNTQESEVWDNKGKSFSSHRFYGFCNNGQPCAAQIEAK